MEKIITWFDIPTFDFDRAIKFYSAILGENIQIDETSLGRKFGFFPIEDTNGVAGNILPPSGGRKPSPDGIRIYFNCEGKLDEVLGRVELVGGKIIKQKHNIGKLGWVALIKDTEGNIVGLHSLR